MAKSQLYKSESKFDYKENGFKTVSFNHVGELLVDTWYMELPFFKQDDCDEDKSTNDLASKFQIVCLIWVINIYILYLIWVVKLIQ